MISASWVINEPFTKISEGLQCQSFFTKKSVNVFRKQNKFKIRNKAGIQSQENGHIYKLRLRHGPCI